MSCHPPHKGAQKGFIISKDRLKSKLFERGLRQTKEKAARNLQEKYLVQPYGRGCARLGRRCS
jgi:hypothetical protein